MSLIQATRKTLHEDLLVPERNRNNVIQSAGFDEGCTIWRSNYMAFAALEDNWTIPTGLHSKLQCTVNYNFRYQKISFSKVSGNDLSDWTNSKRIRVGFGLSWIPSKLICPRKDARGRGVMCNNNHETSDHLIDVVNPTIGAGRISIELSMKSQLFCATINSRLSELDNRH